MPPSQQQEDLLDLVRVHLGQVERGFASMAAEIREFRTEFIRGQDRAMTRLTLVVAFAMVAVLASSGANLYVSARGAQLGTGQAAVQQPAP